MREKSNIWESKTVVGALLRLVGVVWVMAFFVFGIAGILAITNGREIYYNVAWGALYVIVAPIATAFLTAIILYIARGE